MNKNSNSNPPDDRSIPGAADRLDGALEDLVAQAPFRAKAQPATSGNFSSAAAGACPDISQWLELACGEVSVGKKNNLLTHAALCTNCLARLREIQRLASPEVSSEEVADLKLYQSTTPQWQHRLAVELARTPYKGAHFAVSGRFGWLGAALTATLVIAISFGIYWRRENAPERLLAEAYSQSRSFDLRVPGAGFAPVTPQTHLRGGATDHEVAPLLSARAQIERQLEKSPSDSHLLQLKARADVLDERYDEAIDILDRLVDAGPVTASLLVDDGSAYFLRGTAAASENDRATALDYLRRADELAPDDPIVLFNEALVMEDRGQVMNAVETWNRYVKFERDPKWLEEGRAHLKILEDKLNQLKTHESRMEQHLATPQEMRLLAADPVTLASVDEELSSTLLPRLLNAAFTLPVDRSRGSPCDDKCLAARSLLKALAASLENNHQDSWLTETLPSDSNPKEDYLNATHALAQAISANSQGNYPDAGRAALQSQQLFQSQHILAGADRALVERAYALQRSYTYATCHQALQPLIGGENRFAWIEAQSAALDAGCNVSPGTASVDNPRFQLAFELAQTHHYTLLELRARNMLTGSAVESRDSETAWRMCLATIRKFYSGDYPPFRAATTMSGLALVEDSTPRLQLDLLVNREAFGLYALSKNATFLAGQRVYLIRAALRAGSMTEAREQMVRAKQELALAPGKAGLIGVKAEIEIAMAHLYLERGDLSNAQIMLDDAQKQMASEDNPVQYRSYAVARGGLELALKHPEAAEATLHDAILKEELEARGAGEQNIVFARQDRELYAALAGVWLAEGRTGEETLSLWERYRLRILGRAVPACPKDGLDCLEPQLTRALNALGSDQVLGQVVLPDRTLLYQANAHAVTWTTSPLGIDDLLVSTARLEQTVSSPVTSEESVDDAARRVGGELFGGLQVPSSQAAELLLEPDPIFGNVPWPAIETGKGALGLLFNLQETPSLLLDSSALKTTAEAGPQGPLLVVGASEAAGKHVLLPEALSEARAVARFGTRPNVLLANQATHAHVTPLLQTASILHFAGHAEQDGGATRLLLASSGAVGDTPFLDRTLFLKDPPRAARLVVFSACTTGKREDGWDHGMGDIVETLQSLGVPEVVATRWQIDSASAVPMMDVFYRSLAAGLSVPQALTAARQSLIRDARYRHPYYWAAYYASGVGTTNLDEVLHDTSN